MRRAMVAVGVDRTSTADFPPLRAAAASAVSMAQWGRTQGFDVEELTDLTEDVTVAKIFERVSRFVEAGVYDQLLVYFSGHGVLLAPDSEVWLLSQAPRNPNEAVNVTRSIQLARVSGIPHIVFVSDACRSMPPNFRVAALAPGSVFPGQPAHADGPEVDTFYASLPGDPAYELLPAEASEGYRALLTHCMLEALQGQPPTLIKEVDLEGTLIHVVAARELRRHLKAAVPAAARRVSIRLNQSPDIRVESDLPKYLAQVQAPYGSGQIRTRSPKPRDAGQIASQDAAPSPQIELTLAGRLHKQLDALTRSSTLMQRMRTVDSATGAADQPPNMVSRILAAVPNFDAETGFAFYGIGVDRVRVQRGQYQPQLHTPTRLQLAATNPQASARWEHGDAALVRFVDGTGMSLSILPGFIGVVVAEAGRILTVNYLPSRTNRAGWEFYADRREEVEESKALMAALALQGQLRFNQVTAKATAQELRRYKKVDPTLGLFAAYAYALSNINSQVLSVFRHMYRDGVPVLFDVAMLASQVRAGGALEKSFLGPLQRLDFAPWMPVLSQGWLLLGDIEKSMPQALQEARRHLLPGLWTRFAPKGMDLLERGLQ